jgi:hypothetical protein
MNWNEPALLWHLVNGNVELVNGSLFCKKNPDVITTPGSHKTDP